MAVFVDVGPTWPYGSKQYRHQFNQHNPYSEDIFTGYPAPAYGYGYPHYRYHQVIIVVKKRGMKRVLLTVL
jgi:hypothetical protein